MKIQYPEHWPQFYTATIVEWHHLLMYDRHKDIIIDSLQFMVSEKRIILYAFVIMSNHIHIIWQPLGGNSLSGIQASFMKYTAQQLKRSMIKNSLKELDNFKVSKYDRQYQIWKRESLSIELRTHVVFIQKLNYIHLNPVKAGLCINPEDYYYSSVRYYFDGIDNFGMLTHFSGF